MPRLMLAALVLLLGACSAFDRTPPALPTLIPSPTPLPAPLTLDQPVTGALSEVNADDEYAFSANAGDVLEVQVFSGALSFALLDGGGGQVVAGTLTQTTLPTAGRYTLRVMGEPGDYRFMASIAAPTPAATSTPVPVVVGIPTATPPPTDTLGTFQTAISSANPAFGAFNTPDERHVYTFQGAAGSYVRLRMQRTSGDVDPLLTLYAPDGSAIAFDDNGGGGRTAQINGTRLPADGVYSVTAYGGGFAGTYEITLETSLEAFPVTPVIEGSDIAASTPTPTPPVILTPTLASPNGRGDLLFDHVPYVGFIERPGGFRRYQVQVAAGEVFTLGVQPEPGLRVRLDMIDKDEGSAVATVEAPEADGELVVANFTAAVTGAYTVIISGLGDTIGAFRISYGRDSTREDVRQGETFADRTYTGAITRRAVRDVWYVRLNAGDMIRATLTDAAGTLTPVMSLVAPDGSVNFTATDTDGTGSAQIPTARASIGGLYALHVRGAQPDQTGSYTLQWRYIEAAPTATPRLLVSPLLAADDTLTEGDYLYYPLQAYAGERVLIEVDAAPGSGLDGLVALLSPEGEVVGEDDDSGGGLNPRLLVQIPIDGVYQVRVGGYNSGGGFVLRVWRVY